LKATGIALAGAALVAGFIAMGFPYDRLGEYIEAEVRHQTGVVLAIGTLEPSLGLAGPGLRASALRLRWPDGEVLALDAARLRPAWSLSWLRGAPAIRVQLGGPIGEADGVVTLNDAGAWNGDLRRVDLGQLPIESFAPGAAIEGFADAVVDLRLGDPGPEGHLSFEAHDGSVALPAFPVALPYERLSGEIEFGGDAFATVESFDLDGPLVSAKVTGSVRHASVPANAPLALSVFLSAQPGVRPLLESAGLRVSREGSARVNVGGTLSNPVVR
jgi:type II secretion system protein N